MITKHEPYELAEMLLREYMGMHKMHNSQERWLILRHITEITGSFTANDLLEWAQPRYISRATIYNTLELLEKAHIIQCLHVQHNGRLMQYELALGEQCSMQIICTKCGRVSRVADKSTEIAIKMKRYPNFIMRHFSVYVFGECKSCLKRFPKKAEIQKIKEKARLLELEADI